MISPLPRDIPLFLLGVVLFPGAVLPLRVFEERYKLMMEHCLAGDRSFGVVLIKSGQEVGEPATPYDVGTTAHIIDVRPQAGGRMHLITRGDSPFRILKIRESRPYMVGNVEMLNRSNDDSDDMSGLTNNLRKHLETYFSLYSTLTRTDPVEIKLEADHEKLSYLVAHLMRVDSKIKQKLLEISSVTQRIREELNILEQENLAMQLFLTRQGDCEDDINRRDDSPKWQFSSN